MSEVELDRELTLTFRVRVYGTRTQARATADRVARMLSVELHQDVNLVRAEYKEVEL
jgi:hypothetical protein